MLYCPPDALLMPFTNWSRAESFSTADFSPAVLSAGETSDTRSNPLDTVVFYYAQLMRQGPEVPNVIVILGEDLAGNYWLTGTLLPAAWARTEEELERM
ncbi:BCL5p [Paraphaeosphaeria sporulosa]